MKITLSFENENVSGVHTMNGDVTWWELTEQFVNFMNAAGYQVTRKNVADYLDELTESEE